MSLTYPNAHTVDVIEDYHGTPVSDPYRWLEDADSPETQAFIAAQNALTESLIANSGRRESIRARMSELWDYPRYQAASKVGGRYFYLLASGLQNQPVLYMQEGLNTEPRVVLDPNTFSDDGTVALVNWRISEDGKMIAYLISRSGSDAQECRILDIDSGKTYDETLMNLRFTMIAWRPDKSGFYYNRYPDPESVAPEDRQAYSRLYFHKLGTPQSEDVLVFERLDAKELNFPPHITDDELYLTLYVWHGAINRNRFYYRRMDDPTGDFVRLIDEANASYQLIGTVSTYFYFLTDLDAPRGRIIAIDIENPDPDNWIEVVSEGADVINEGLIINQQIVLMTTQDATNRLKVYSMNGSFEYEIALPTLGSIYFLNGNQFDSELMFTFTSYLAPFTVYRYDFASRTLEVFKKPEIKFNPDDFETRQVFFESKDGTRVPMFISHKRGLEIKGDTPTLLYGYGGFSVPLTPALSVPYITWMEQGGVYVVANLRGGSEYGEDWHQAGMLDRKQNVFDDFIGAAEWLIANGYTRPERLAIAGGSNGGLLVAACMLQRPDLYGAVLCLVPVTDMLRYHKFTAGRYWVPEYGNAEENAEHFKFMMAYSPLHNVKAGATYPPIYIHTAESDDRVVPMHAMKFAATLQAQAPAENPYLLRIETKAGHGMGKPVSKLIDQYTDLLTFAGQHLAME